MLRSVCRVQEALKQVLERPQQDYVRYRQYLLDMQSTLITRQVDGWSSTDAQYLWQRSRTASLLVLDCDIWLTRVVELISMSKCCEQFGRC